MKQVRESKAAGSLSAWVIMKGAKEVATVQAHYGDSRVQVDIYTPEGGLVYQGSASGYGYDKFTSALDGAKIGGVTLYDHSTPVYKRGTRVYPDGYKNRGGHTWLIGTPLKMDMTVYFINQVWTDYGPSAFQSFKRFKEGVDNEHQNETV